MHDVHGGRFTPDMHSRLTYVGAHGQRVSLSINEQHFDVAVRVLETTLGIAMCQLDLSRMPVPPFPRRHTSNIVQDGSGPRGAVGSGQGHPQLGQSGWAQSGLCLKCTARAESGQTPPSSALSNVFFPATSQRYPRLVFAMQQVTADDFERNKMALGWALHLHSTILSAWWAALCAEYEQHSAGASVPAHQIPLLHSFIDRAIEWNQYQFIDIFCMFHCLTYFESRQTYIN